mmetsp:Transcript_115077/g.229167  ORF Transcript_115077/g.229167 Transcript_115077/m.229167 type:complete len:207 (+) Transcript_115077:38-658(+)
MGRIPSPANYILFPGMGQCAMNFGTITPLHDLFALSPTATGSREVYKVRASLRVGWENWGGGEDLDRQQLVLPQPCTCNNGSGTDCTDCHQEQGTCWEEESIPVIMIVDCTDLISHAKAPDQTHNPTWLQAVQLLAELADLDKVVACGGTGGSICTALVSIACAWRTWTLDLLPQLAILFGLFCTRCWQCAGCRLGVSAPIEVWRR